MRKTGKISLVIPTFNRLALLKKTVQSVFWQVEPADEVIVVDDSSRHATWNFLKSLSGIKLFRNRTNLGSFENINKSIQLAKFDYVIVLGSDDLILPNCIKVYRQTITRIGNNPAVYFSAGYHINENDRLIGFIQPFDQNKLFSPTKSVKEFWDNYWFQLLIGGWSAWKKQVFQDVGFFTRKYGRAAENEMTLKILSRYPVYYINQPLFAYRIHKLAGLEGQEKNKGRERGIDEAADSARVLLDYEADPAIKAAFKISEQRERIFVRKPTNYFLIVGLFYIFVGKISLGIKFLNLFVKFYPKPILRLVTLKILTGWLVQLGNNFIKNAKLKLAFSRKPISSSLLSYSGNE